MKALRYASIDDRPLQFLGSLASVLVACGGQISHDAVQTAAAPAAAASPDREAPAQVATAGPTTTTTELAEREGAQSSKLSPTPTVASATRSAKEGRGHEAGRGPADIRAVVLAHRDEARACYEKLASGPGVEGDLVIVWTIDPNGHVTHAEADASRSQIVTPALVSCVVDIVKRIQFAASPGGFETRASYPLNFRPRRGEQTK